MPELFAYPERLWLLALIPVALVAGWAFMRARRRALARYVGAMPPGRLAPGQWRSGRICRAAMALCGAALLIVAIARPQWGERSEVVVRRGVDVVIALDTSRSMACEDVGPSRFERARLAIADLLARRAGDRISLLPFSQNAGVACPLTLDYAAVRLFLDAAQVGEAPSPGTNISRAIKSAEGAFDPSEKKYKVLVLLTDGEDHEGGALAAAEEARGEGIVIYALGVGTPAGGPIPLRDETGELQGYHRDAQGKVVTTRLDLDLLEKVTDAAGGRTFSLGPTGEEVVRLCEEIDGLDKKEQKGTLASRREERYRWPLAGALVLLAAEPLIPRVRRRRGAEVLA